MCNYMQPSGQGRQNTWASIYHALVRSTCSLKRREGTSLELDRAPEPWGKESDKGIQCLPPIPLQVGHVNKFDGLGLASSTRAIWIGRFLFLSAWTDGTVSFPDRSRRRTCHEKPWLHLFLSRRNSASSQWFDKGRWMTLRSRWNQQGASLPCMSDCLMLVENGKTGQISRLLMLGH
jgi:hypothetical protein